MNKRRLRIDDRNWRSVKWDMVLQKNNRYANVFPDHTIALKITKLLLVEVAHFSRIGYLISEPKALSKCTNSW